ncbi:Testis-specific chromodomain-containing protein [Fusarium heterosporum]|uniref:Testis-specific chromodomain-containing protein n=1 Tax=Fusarium heterosporum TaxID=42747 RepID=A0A8H5WNU7_FUSHE|nr:Testis-specific chromodomain-containing protein [Fusarium heterosporum]
MPSPERAPTVFYARDKSPFADLDKGPRQSIEDVDEDMADDEESLSRVVLDLQGYESFDDDECRSVTPDHIEEMAIPEKRSLSHNEESNEEDPSKAVKPPPKRRRRTSPRAPTALRRSKRLTSAPPVANDGKVPTTGTIGKKGPGRPTQKSKARLRNPQAEVIEPATSRRVRNAPVNKDQVTRSQDEVEWEVEEIVDSQVDATTKKHFYLVKWKGFSEKDNTWEPKEHLGNCLKMIRDFEKN